MTDTEEAPTFDATLMKKKKSRKSVAFEGEGEGAATNGGESPIQDPAGEDKDVSELTEQFKDLKKKKKKKSSTDENGDDAPATVDGEFDPTVMKKKKKKKSTKEPVADSFDAQLAEAGVVPRDAGEEGAEEAPAEIRPEDAGDLIAGTGVWNSVSTVDLTYPLLLTRFFTLLRSQHPDLAGEGRRNYKIPPPQVLREGNKKTIFANISDICKRMKRHDEHVTQFLFAELGTSGSVDGSKRLVIRGKFQQKQLENVLRRYILEYVTCRTCKSPDTDLKKGENRLFFVTCNSCGSRRSVAAIKTGFQATVGKRRRQKV
ncbi:domain found in IF2B/IF5-domain-containing protein [Trichophaea hybrida]|nr:domain found in IF2B/IF5-domain-containing protein [Trichophaea hybrida]